MAETTGQAIVNGALRWHRSGVDEKGMPYEEDGIGLPPDHVRQLLYLEEGVWEVMVSGCVSKPKVLGVMRNALNLDMASATELLKCIPGKVYLGTRVEADWIVSSLSKAGAEAVARRQTL